MKFKLSILLIFFSFFSFANTISHKIEKLDNGNHKVISTISLNKELGLAKLQMNIPDGIEVLISPENKLPSKTAEGGISFYIYKSEENVEFIYEITSLITSKKITFLLQYSVENDRYEQDLSGLILTENDVESEDIISEAILIGTAVGPETKLAQGEVFTVQIIALSNYNALRFEAFCKKNNLNPTELTKWQENNLTKYGIGNYISKEEGLMQLAKLKKATGLSDMFLTKRLIE